MRVAFRNCFLWIVLFAVTTNSFVESGALDRLFGGWKSEPDHKVPPEVERELSMYEKMTNKMTSIGAGMLQSMGSVLPLKGIASFAADLGIPGAAAMMEILTPKTPRDIISNRSFSATGAFNHRSKQGRERAPSASQRRSSTGGYSSFRPELHSFMGSAHGDRECMLKLACLAGKRLSSVSGASAVAIMMSTASNMLPKSIRGPYSALKNSVLYSDDCSQYICSTDNTHEGL